MAGREHPERRRPELEFSKRSSRCESGVRDGSRAALGHREKSNLRISRAADEVSRSVSRLSEDGREIIGRGFQTGVDAERALEMLDGGGDIALPESDRAKAVFSHRKLRLNVQDHLILN